MHISFILYIQPTKVFPIGFKRFNVKYYLNRWKKKYVILLVQLFVKNKTKSNQYCWGLFDFYNFLLSYIYTHIEDNINLCLVIHTQRKTSAIGPFMLMIRQILKVVEPG